MGELYPFLICLVAAWAGNGWPYPIPGPSMSETSGRDDPVTRRVRNCPELRPTAILRRGSPEPHQGITIEPFLLAQLWMSQSQSCNIGEFSTLMCLDMLGPITGMNAGPVVLTMRELSLTITCCNTWENWPWIMPGQNNSDSLIRRGVVEVGPQL